MKEQQRNLGTIISRAVKMLNEKFNGLDSNPKNIVKFPNHLPSCTRLMPLKIEEKLEIVAAPSVGTTGSWKVVERAITCSECGGKTIVDQVELDRRRKKFLEDFQEG